MSDNSTPQYSSTFSRPARLEDFFDEGDTTDKTNKHKYEKHYSKNDSIEKNQQEFGHKKRIKP
jgi:hypothetical protein